MEISLQDKTEENSYVHSLPYTCKVEYNSEYGE